MIFGSQKSEVRAGMEHILVLVRVGIAHILINILCAGHKGLTSFHGVLSHFRCISEQCNPLQPQL